MEVGTLKMAPRGHCSSRVESSSSSYFHLQLTRRVDLSQYFTIDWNEFGNEDGNQGNRVTVNNLKEGNINVKLYFLISCNIEIVIIINSF